MTERPEIDDKSFRRCCSLDPRLNPDCPKTTINLSPGGPITGCLIEFHFSFRCNETFGDCCAGRLRPKESLWMCWQPLHRLPRASRAKARQSRCRSSAVGNILGIEMPNLDQSTVLCGERSLPLCCSPLQTMIPLCLQYSLIIWFKQYRTNFRCHTQRCQNTKDK